MHWQWAGGIISKLLTSKKITVIRKIQKALSFFKGAVGFTVSAGKYGQNAKAIRKAVNKAGLRMVYVDRYFGMSTV